MHPFSSSKSSFYFVRSNIAARRWFPSILVPLRSSLLWWMVDQLELLVFQKTMSAICLVVHYVLQRDLQEMKKKSTLISSYIPYNMSRGSYNLWNLISRFYIYNAYIEIFFVLKPCFVWTFLDVKSTEINCVFPHV